MDERVKLGLFGRAAVIRHVIMAASGLGLMAVLLTRLGSPDLTASINALVSLPMWRWAVVLCATAGSYLAFGMFDAGVHRLAGSPVPHRIAALAGMVSGACSQTIGFGPVTGALARWRLLQGVDLPLAVRISLLSSAAFLSVWVMLAVLIAACNPTIAPTVPVPLRLAMMAAVICALWMTGPTLRRKMTAWPGLTRTPSIGLVLAAVVDMSLAGLALWAVMPADVPPQIVLAAYILALGPALIGGTPGGLGPFELALIALLPQVPAADLIITTLTFRLIYHALPALIALPFLARPQVLGDHRNPSPDLNARAESALNRAPRAEAGLLRQGRLHLGPQGLSLPIGRLLVQITDPFGPCPKGDLTALDRRAKSTFRRPFLYKASPRTAAHARRRGWAVLPVAHEYWLAPLIYAPTSRSLRRALGKASRAGVTIQTGGMTLPMAEMARIAKGWETRHRREKGLSMGQFCPDYIRCQQVFLAYQAGKLVGFVSFHLIRKEMTLDLLRAADDCPDGTMQALIDHAIRSAARRGVTRLSLAAAPWSGQDIHPLIARLRRRASRSGAGLIRFKTTFATRRETLYIAAPDPLTLVWGAALMAWRINRPGPLPPRCPDRQVKSPS